MISLDPRHPLARMWVWVGCHFTVHGVRRWPYKDYGKEEHTPLTATVFPVRTLVTRTE